jgi:hypothetical protein
LTLKFWREADGTSRFEVVEQDGPEIQVVEEAWTPWTLAESAPA